MAIYIVDLPMKIVIFHSYVCLPEGIHFPETSQTQADHSCGLSRGQPQHPPWPGVMCPLYHAIPCLTIWRFP